ncbi:MAG: DUF2249 domain-containing protein [Propionibacteriaceae bacterium]|nr:DUF2249 domain-containing protein [Micropruina sp.]HBY22321.1 hypothetical protein [Propionibacteriaceae bacterium]
MNEIPLATAKKGGGCGCGCSTEETPTWDIRSIPKAIRHGAILGAVASLKPGRSFFLEAPHVPNPVLTQVRHVEGDAVTIEVLENSEGYAKVQLTRAE